MAGWPLLEPGARGCRAGIRGSWPVGLSLMAARLAIKDGDTVRDVDVDSVQDRERNSKQADT